jgi:hypothetical protein
MGLRKLKSKVMLKEVGWVNPEEIKIITVVCNPGNAVFAKESVNKINDVTSNLAFQLRYADYLDINAWFVTEGQHLIFSPGC